MNQLLQLIISCVFILTHFTIKAQIFDDFSDGDFVLNPTWSGTDAHFTVNGSFQLQLNNTLADTSYLSTPHGLLTLDDKEWRIWVKQAFSPSGGNYGRVYLTSNNANLEADPDGFFLQFGEAGSNDAVRLFKHTGGTDIELIAGTLGQIASSFEVSVRITRDAGANWKMFIDGTGGQNYSFVGAANDPENLLGSHVGMLDIYTMSNSTDFYYDDIYVGDEIIDTDPPILLSATAINANQIDVVFDEALDQITAENILNYDIQPFQSASSATLDAVDLSLVHIVPTSALINGNTYTLFSDGIADSSGIVSGSQSVQFSYFIGETPVLGDVIVNEFMCDPSPPVGLSEAEFIEVYNVSNKIFNVENWTIGDASGDGTIGQAWLLPGEYMVLTATSDVGAFGSAVGVSSFPSYNNAGDDILLKDDLGNLLDFLSYTDEWYHDATKANGGYSIERINPNDPCSDEDNWSASNHAWGGTPGDQNSNFDDTPDVINPNIEALIAISANQLEVYFTEGMDSTSIVGAAVTTSPMLTIQNQTATGQFPNLLSLQFAQNLTPSQTYTIEIQNVADCWANTTTLSGTFALADTAVEGDVVINEIMFNPITGGTDWVEVYNNSQKLIDLYNWELANYDNDTIDNHKTLEDHFYLYPDMYAVVTEDSSHIQQVYPTHEVGNYIQMDIPSFNNDSSTIYLITNGTVMDKVSYSEDWHFALLDDFDGKSLERIDPEGLSNDSDNWHTAAEAVGFATPGLENSQFNPAIMNGDFSFTDETISPDNDGFQDVLQVNYKLEENGLVGDFNIYDDRGRKIATVLKSELLASEGTFTWDGVRDDGTKATIGTYVAVFEAFNIDGSISFAKRKAFVVAGKI